MVPAGRGCRYTVNSSAMKPMHKSIFIVLLTIFSIGFLGCGGDKTDIEKAVLKLLWGSKVSNFRRITVGPLQMNYLFLKEYSECGELTMDRMFSLDFQIQTLMRFQGHLCRSSLLLQPNQHPGPYQPQPIRLQPVLLRMLIFRLYLISILGYIYQFLRLEKMKV